MEVVTGLCLFSDVAKGYPGGEEDLNRSLGKGKLSWEPKVTHQLGCVWLLHKGAVGKQGWEGRQDWPVGGGAKLRLGFL